MKATLFALFVGLLMVGCGEPESEFERTKRLAEGGDKVAQGYLGWMYDTGEGVPEDKKGAVKWYTKAAEQGDADAQHNLGTMYANGEVDEDGYRNYRQAFIWFRKAAEQGLAEDQFNLGEMYGEGKGVPRDTKEAVKWYTKAAEQGHAEAQWQLGLYYHIEVPQSMRDNVTAYAWIAVAKENANIGQVKQGFSATRVSVQQRVEGTLFMVAQELNKEQIKEAKKLAIEIQKRIEANQS
jgi:uncharacterized protein